MQEIIDKVLLYIRGMWRYRWYAMVLAWIICLSGWVYIAQMPDQYQASARVYVDTDSILRPLLRGLVVQTDVRQRVRLITQTLLSRPNLEKVARMTDQDITAKSPEEMEDLLNRLNKNIKLASTREEQNLYTIFYEYHDPEVAKSIVQSILTIFVEGSLGDARQDTDVAHKFIDQQIEEYESRLLEAEDRLVEFKRKNFGLLPGQGGDFFSQLKSAHAELEQAKLILSEAQQRREELQVQLEELENEQDHSILAALGNPVTAPLDARIQSLQTQLDNMLLRYTEFHPDVKEFKATIAALEEQKEKELAAMSPQEISSLTGGNSLYQQLQLALSQADANAAAAQVRLKEYTKRVAIAKELLDKQPEVEAELKRLNRDYEVNKKNYEALLGRRESVKLSEDAERIGDNVKFKVIDPPRVPMTPSGPNRLLLSSLALFVGLGAGLVFSLLMSQIKPVIFDGNNLRQLTGYPVLGAVSREWTAQNIRNRRMAFFAFLSIGVFLLLLYTGVLVFFGMDVTNPGQVVETVRGWL